jgi:hypothetical protein
MGLLDSASVVEVLSQEDPSRQQMAKGPRWSLFVIVSVGGNPRSCGMECYSMHSLVCSQAREVEGMISGARPLLVK